MKTVRKLTAAAMAACMGIGCVQALSAAAAGEKMTFSLKPDRQYLTESALASRDATLHGEMYIENYEPFSQLRLQLISDAPLVIENGDFTRDPSEKDPDGEDRQAFFAKHGTSIYTGVNDKGEVKNICLWYGPGDEEYDVIPLNGVIRDRNSSFLNFDVAVPKGTKAGVYEVSIATGTFLNPIGNKEDYLVVVDEDGKDLAQPVLKSMQIVVEPKAMRGDVDCNGTVDAADAMHLMKYIQMRDVLEEETGTYEESSLGTPYIHTAMDAADTNADSGQDQIDVLRILKYVQMQMLEDYADWDQIK